MYTKKPGYVNTVYIDVYIVFVSYKSYTDFIYQ